MKRRHIDTGNDPLNLRIPDPLRELVRDDAAKLGCTRQAVILDIMAKHYKIQSPSPVRGRPRAPQNH